VRRLLRWLFRMRLAPGGLEARRAHAQAVARLDRARAAEPNTAEAVADFRAAVEAALRGHR